MSLPKYERWWNIEKLLIALKFICDGSSSNALTGQKLSLFLDDANQYKLHNCQFVGEKIVWSIFAFYGIILFAIASNSRSFDLLAEECVNREPVSFGRIRNWKSTFVSCINLWSFKSETLFFQFFGKISYFERDLTDANKINQNNYYFELYTINLILIDCE